MRDEETTSYREEQGKPPFETPDERIRDVPLAPGSGGVLRRGASADDEGSSADADREAAKRRAGGDAGSS